MYQQKRTETFKNVFLRSATPKAGTSEGNICRWLFTWVVTFAVALRDGSTLFPGGRLSSISKVSSWLESYMKMPKHMILLLLQVKFSVSKDSFFSFCLIVLIKKPILLVSFIPVWLPCAEIDAGDILQLFGKMFFEFCQESGYDTILRVLGSNVREFLQVKTKRSRNLSKDGMVKEGCCNPGFGFRI